MRKLMQDAQEELKQEEEGLTQDAEIAARLAKLNAGIKASGQFQKSYSGPVSGSSSGLATAYRLLISICHVNNGQYWMEQNCKSYKCWKQFYTKQALTLTLAWGALSSKNCHRL